MGFDVHAVRSYDTGIFHWSMCNPRNTSRGTMRCCNNSIPSRRALDVLYEIMVSHSSQEDDEDGWLDLNWIVHAAKSVLTSDEVMGAVDIWNPERHSA